MHLKRTFLDILLNKGPRLKDKKPKAICSQNLICYLKNSIIVKV